jgi:hypothetical protein
MNHFGWNMLPAEVSLLCINILSGVQQCFSILLKKWSFGEQGPMNKKSTTCCTVYQFSNIKRYISSHTRSALLRVLEWRNYELHTTGILSDIRWIKFVCICIKLNTNLWRNLGTEMFGRTDGRTLGTLKAFSLFHLCINNSHFQGTIYIYITRTHR